MSSEELEPSNEKQLIANLDDVELLANIGYKQELKRSFSLLSMIGFSFSILTCWTALSGSLGEVFLNGGPAALFWGWLGVCVLSMFVVVSLAEICSAYPVAGGQYSWVLLLARNKSWGRGLSYVCGWIQLAGLVCMGSTALYQFGEFVTAMANYNSGTEPHAWSTVLYCWALGVFCLCINIWGNSLLHYIANVCLWWSILGFFICFITILACAPKLQTASFVFTSIIYDAGGWSNKSMAIIIGIMQSAYGMCCYDAPAHMSEEMAHAARDAPRSMVLSVVIGAVSGIGFILALLYSIQDLENVEASSIPLLEIFYQATQNMKGALTLTFIVLYCQINAANALLTEGSRSIYSFARDGAFPAFLNKWLCTVHPKLEVPLPALLVCLFFECVFIAIDFGSEAAFFTVLSIASTGLYVSYLIPMVVSVICREDKAPGYYNLGKWAYLVNIPGILYLTFCSVFFFFPTSIPVDGNNMNYCSVAFGITFLFGIICWLGGGRKYYIHKVDTIESVEATISQPASTQKNVQR